MSDRKRMTAKVRKKSNKGMQALSLGMCTVMLASNVKLGSHRRRTA